MTHSFSDGMVRRLFRLPYVFPSTLTNDFST